MRNKNFIKIISSLSICALFPVFGSAIYITQNDVVDKNVVQLASYVSSRNITTSINNTVNQKFEITARDALIQMVDENDQINIDAFEKFVIVNFLPDNTTITLKSHLIYENEGKLEMSLIFDKYYVNGDLFESPNPTKEFNVWIMGFEIYQAPFNYLWLIFLAVPVVLLSWLLVWLYRRNKKKLYSISKGFTI